MPKGEANCRPGSPADHARDARDLAILHYAEKRVSSPALAKHFGVSEKHVSDLRRAAGITRRYSPRSRK